MSNSAIYQNCSTKGHPFPNIDQFKVINQEKSPIAREAKEATQLILNLIEMLTKFPVYLTQSWDKAKKSMHYAIIVSGDWILGYWYKPHTISLFH